MEICYPRSAEVIKVAVCGEPKVGKSAFIKSFVLGLYDPYLQSAMDLDFMTREIKVDEDTVVLQLWESQPQSFNCAIVLYDVSNRDSFVKTLNILKDIRIKHSEELPILLLANKIDSDNKRQVMMYEGELAALRYSALFEEISCIESTNTKKSVIKLVTSMLSLNAPIE